MKAVRQKITAPVFVRQEAFLTNFGIGLFVLLMVFLAREVHSTVKCISLDLAARTPLAIL